MSFSSCEVNDFLMFVVEENFSVEVVAYPLDIYLNEKKK